MARPRPQLATTWRDSLAGLTAYAEALAKDWKREREAKEIAHGALPTLRAFERRLSRIAIGGDVRPAPD